MIDKQDSPEGGWVTAGWEKPAQKFIVYTYMNGVQKFVGYHMVDKDTTNEQAEAYCQERGMTFVTLAYGQAEASTIMHMVALGG